MPCRSVGHDLSPVRLIPGVTRPRCRVRLARGALNGLRSGGSKNCSRKLIPALAGQVILTKSCPRGPVRELGGLGQACRRRSGTLQLVLDADAVVSDDSQTAGSGMARPASASPAIAAERECGRDGWHTCTDAAHLAHIPQFFDRSRPARCAGPRLFQPRWCQLVGVKVRPHCVF